MGVHGQDIKKPTSKRSSSCGKPGESLGLKPGCGLGRADETQEMAVGEDWGGPALCGARSGGSRQAA